VLSDYDLADTDLVVALDALCGSVDDSSAFAIRLALVNVIARLIEARLLGDEELREIARYPSVYLADARDLVAERVTALGLKAVVSEEDVVYVSRLLTTGAPLQPERVSDDLVSALFRNVRLQGVAELRCAICGYHFREADLSESRRFLAEQFGLIYAADFLEGRVRDPLKTTYKTALHVDHVVPRIGWGPTRVENLQVLCEFCNIGKLIYRRSLENVSGFAAFGVPPLDGVPPDGAIAQTVVAALMQEKNGCVTCGATASQRELTVERRREWFVPWTLEVRCYDCVNGM
jgi:hypothetical protein